MQTQVTLTKHYTDSGTNDRGSWTRNDFVAEDGTTRFKTFDGDVASKAKALLGVPCVVTYDLKERGQYVDNILKDIAPAPGVTQQDVTQAQAQTAAATTERGEREKAKQERFVLYVPQDGVVASSLDKTAPTRIVDWGTHAVADIQSYPKKPDQSSLKVGENEMILDIGPFSGAFIAGSIQLANTVIWNGTMGVTEVKGLQGPVGPFAHGTDLVIDAMLGDYGHRPFSLVGGGDTVGYVEDRDLTTSFNHVSTGGGASLDLMAGRTLPGVEALQDA